jgi:HK97 family phage prohead protease
MPEIYEHRNLPETADEMRALEADRLVTANPGDETPLEQRAINLGDVRARTTDTGRRAGGHAIVFDSPSVDMGGWYEVIARDALTDLLETDPDTRLLVNHDGLPLARTASGTLLLEVDDEGLGWDADLPDTTLGRDVPVLLDRGDLNQMSFRFRVAPGGSVWTIDADGRERRTITAIASMPEISIVTFPAYQATSAGRRSAPAADENDTTSRAEGAETTPNGDIDQRNADPGAAERWRARVAINDAVHNHNPQEGTHA